MTSSVISHWASELNLVTIMAASTSFDRVARTLSWLQEAPTHVLTKACLLPAEG